MNNSLQEYLNFANKLADAAGITSMEYFRTSLSIDNKSDESPVTIADKNTELKIRSLIENEYPDHGILGEEFDSVNPDAEFIWVIDPIDGTRSYIAEGYHRRGVRGRSSKRSAEVCSRHGHCCPRGGLRRV
jgi:fructose-1,6-bisphosphatase/inositol monophosphatase family enzyme